MVDEKARRFGIDIRQKAPKIKSLIDKGKRVGYVTTEEVDTASGSGAVSTEIIEDIMSTLAEMGINVQDSAEADTTTVEYSVAEVEADSDSEWGMSVMEQDIKKLAIKIAENTLNDVRIGSESDKNIIRNILAALEEA